MYYEDMLLFLAVIFTGGWVIAFLGLTVIGIAIQPNIWRGWKVFTLFAGFQVGWWFFAYMAELGVSVDSKSAFTVFLGEFWGIGLFMAVSALVLLGLWKSYELLRSPKTEEKKE